MYRTKQKKLERLLNFLESVVSYTQYNSKQEQYIMATNKQTILAFLLQKADKGSNAGGSIFFEGRKLYSCGHHYLLAYLDRPGCILVNSRKYTQMTSRHATQVCTEAVVLGLEVYRESLPYRGN